MPCKLAKTVAKTPRSSSAQRRKPSVPPAFPIVGVGASARGSESISVLLKSMRSDTGMSFVIIRHLGTTFPHQYPHLGSLKLHFRAQRLKTDGDQVIVLTVGDATAADVK